MPEIHMGCPEGITGDAAPGYTVMIRRNAARGHSKWVVYSKHNKGSIYARSLNAMLRKLEKEYLKRGYKI